MEIEVKSWREKPILDWSVEDVVGWAKSKDGADIDEEDAEKLRKQKIKGKTLLYCTEEKFQRWGIPIGPSLDLFSAVSQLKEIKEDKTHSEASEKRSSLDFLVTFLLPNQY
eukprot:TRINITY_DN2962_c0_g1_i4.p2 TRINITY_DN2962_c0_g1~~TRINITY_DN2962_c0_g1_i4.p2  ORF type:complete len:111 (+),score=23.16 TRINITY_DN2962_c0_g1_i4:1466-1798(+)